IRPLTAPRRITCTPRPCRGDAQLRRRIVQAIKDRVDDLRAQTKVRADMDMRRLPRWRLLLNCIGDAECLLHRERDGASKMQLRLRGFLEIFVRATASAPSVVCAAWALLFSEAVPCEAPRHRECRAREDSARPSTLGSAFVTSPSAES